MRLIRDVLDKQLVDAQGHKMGRVDGIVIEFAADKQPRVTFIEVGAVTQYRRVSARLSRFVAACARRWGREHPDPYRIPWAKVVPTGIDVTVDTEAEETPALAWERWLRARVVGRIPGA